MCNPNKWSSKIDCRCGVIFLKERDNCFIYMVNMILRFFFDYPKNIKKTFR